MLSRLIAKVEGLQVSFGQWIAGFLGIIFIRFFLENLSSPTPSFPAVPDALTLVHYGLFYLAVFLLLALVLRIFVQDIAAISKFILFAFPICWLPPIIDLVVSHGGGSLMTYAFASGGTLWQDFLTLGGSYASGGITLGIKIELVIVLLGTAFYVFIKTKNIAKAVAAAALAYLVLFFLIALPSFLVFGAVTPLGSLISVFSISHIAENFLRPTVELSYQYGLETLFNLGMAQCLYLLDFILAVAWLALYRRQMLCVLLKNIRPGRIIHFLMMIIFGAWFAAALHGAPFFSSAIDWVAFLNLLITFMCAWLFAVMVNDVADVAIDAVSNRSRPMITGAASLRDMQSVGLFFLIWSLLGGYLVGYWAFFAIATFTAAYYIYSAPPLRLKQIPIIATFLISLACLSAVLAGFYFVSPVKVLADFPLRVLLLIIIFFTLAVNFKDLKDIDGDRADGIVTIPVAFPRYGKEIVGAMVVVAFFAVPVILALPILYIPSLIAAIAGYYYCVNADRYREWIAFIGYFIYIIAAIALVVR